MLYENPSCVCRTYLSEALGLRCQGLCGAHPQALGRALSEKLEAAISSGSTAK